MRDDIKIMTRRDLTWTMVNIYLVSGNMLLDGILITCRSSFWLLYDDSLSSFQESLALVASEHNLGGFNTSVLRNAGLPSDVNVSGCQWGAQMLGIGATGDGLLGCSIKRQDVMPPAHVGSPNASSPTASNGLSGSI